MKAILVAYSDNHMIGNQGAIPWMGKMPADMRRVRELTANQAIIMGKATFTSIGHPLPRRQNIVLTHDQTFSAAGVDVAQSLDDGLALVENERNSFIFGGAKVYAESLRRAVELDITTVFATEIHARFSGDAKFPELDPDTWQEVDRTDFPADNENMFAYSFVKYERFLS